MNEFTVGDIVEVTCADRGINVGKRGKVVDIYESDVIVDFYNGVDGCRERGRGGYCWWMPPECLKKVDESEDKR